ncbi:hypothetical protein N7G274_000860 [Stereocaulon virgatum]|uniref:Expansin-like EG45 domain-containing protein n=1 Tax=Stereocaulon virgatum TaxID=373712 RepID=A0ABR4AM74_9LECA
MHHHPIFPAILFFLPTLIAAINPILSSSFTWNQNCGPTVACGPLAAGIRGIGYAAANNATYASNQPVINGVGAGCGQCWHLQPLHDQFPSNGLRLGTPVVVKVNDQCTDAGYCDQEEGANSANVNTRYGKQVHFDLCNATGVTDQFFGEVGAGVVMGLARRLDDCSQLKNGPFGSRIGTLGVGREGLSLTGQASGIQVVPGASGTGSVGGAFQVATAAASSSVIASSSAVNGIIPVSSGRIAPGNGSLAGNADVASTNEYAVDGDSDDDYCGEL